MIYAILGLSAGAGMPMQTSINARLVKRTGNPFTSSLINFIVGTAVLMIIAMFTEYSNVLHIAGLKDSPPWILFGGCFAVVFISTNILLMPRLGSIQTVIIPALGQLIMATLIDQFGIFGVEIKTITPARMAGMLLVLAEVIMIVLAKAGKTESRKPALAVNAKKNLNGWRLLGLISGMCQASQTAVNGQLGIVVESRVVAATINFTVGTIILIIINLILIRKIKAADKIKSGPAWIWIGGLFGDLYVIVNIIVAQTLGTSVSVIFVLTGMMAGGLIVDHFGLFESIKRRLTIKKTAGVIIMIVGIAVFQLL